jgi:hypothetical protein
MSQTRRLRSAVQNVPYAPYTVESASKCRTSGAFAAPLLCLKPQSSLFAFFALMNFSARIRERTHQPLGAQLARQQGICLIEIGEAVR